MARGTWREMCGSGWPTGMGPSTMTVPQNGTHRALRRASSEFCEGEDGTCPRLPPSHGTGKPSWCQRKEGRSQGSVAPLPRNPKRSGFGKTSATGQVRPPVLSPSGQTQQCLWVAPRMEAGSTQGNPGYVPSFPPSLSVFRGWKGFSYADSIYRRHLASFRRLLFRTP